MKKNKEKNKNKYVDGTGLVSDGKGNDTKSVTRPKKFKALRILLVLVIITAFSALLVVGATSYFISKNTDYTFDEELFASARGDRATKFYYNAALSAGSSDTGEYIPAEIEEERLSYDGKMEWKDFDSIPDWIKKAFISIEDKNFYRHHGIDYKRTLKAAANYIFHFDGVFGASTITQQVVKNISGDNKVTVKRKVSEAARAIHLEKRHSKEEIFEVYMNIAPMSDNIYGVGAAAKYYFGKEIDELTLAECASIAAVTNSPAIYDPRVNPDKCVYRRDLILSKMLEYGYIDKEEYDGAVAEPLVTVKVPEGSNDNVSSWYIETVINDCINDLCREKNISRSAASAIINGGGLSIYTLMDPRVQNIMENYFENESNFSPEIKNGLEYSMICIDPERGNILGIIGGVGKKSGNRLLNNATDSKRAPGSALKPLALYAPLLDEKKINWATVFDDVPVEFIKSGDIYKPYPVNSPVRYDGLITVKDALKVSKNTVAMRLYKMLGAEKIYYNLTKKLHLDGLVRKGYGEGGDTVTDLAPSPLALGQLSYGVTLRSLTNAYTVFPSDGIYRNARSYSEVYDMNGVRLLSNTASEGERVFEKETARIMNMMLSEVVSEGTAARITLKNTVDTAGKTGTSGSGRDKLFIGYTPYVTAGIWCGYKNGDGGVDGIYPTHIKIWDDIMKKIHSELLEDGETEKHFKLGKDIIKAEYCRDSGRIWCSRCENDPRGCRKDVGYFTEDNKPEGLCNRHVKVLYDVAGEGLATGKCPLDELKTVSLLNITDRDFPCEVYISDAQYVWRNISADPYPGNDKPYFYSALEDGHYAGISYGKRQFNSVCATHLNEGIDGEGEVKGLFWKKRFFRDIITPKR